MYNKYEFDPDIQREMQEFEASIARENAELEAHKRQYEAIRDADWERIKAKEKPPTQKSDGPYATRREILQSCKKTTPEGGGYYSLGEYYRKLNGR